MKRSTVDSFVKWFDIGMVCVAVEIRGLESSALSDLLLDLSVLNIPRKEWSESQR